MTGDEGRDLYVDGGLLSGDEHADDGAEGSWDWCSGIVTGCRNPEDVRGDLREVENERVDDLICC
jgi:hypothetical protein